MDEFENVTRLYCEDVEYEEDEENKDEKFCHIYEKGFETPIVRIFSEINVDSEGSCKKAFHSTYDISEDGFFYEDIIFEEKADVTCRGVEGSSLECKCKGMPLTLEDFLEEFE